MTPTTQIPSTPRRRPLGRRAAALGVLLAIVATVSTPSPAAAWSAGTYDASYERVVFTLTNQARASAGLAALRNDSYLVGVARWRSKDMVVRDYFSHNIPPTGETVFAKLQRDGYCFQVAGENIGGSSASDDAAGSRLQNAWMNSAGHRANILGDWTSMGVGTYKRADGYKMYTVLFAKACGAAPKPTARPTPKPVPDATPKPVPVATPKPAPVATPKPTVRPAQTPAATPVPASPSPSPTPTASDDSASPTVAPSPTSELEPVASASAPPGGGVPAAPPPAGPDPASTGVTLRVREPARSDGLLDGLLRALFGGLLGS